MHDRLGPTGRRSAAAPPWFTTPLRFPTLLVLSAVRLGKHGTSDAYTLANRTPLPRQRIDVRRRRPVVPAHPR
jgi:hypothetical protein